MTTFKEMMQEKEPEELEDIAQYGCSGGAGGFIYYSDNNKIYEEYEDEIWDALHEDAEAMGCKNEMELISSFGGAAVVHSSDQFRNLLVWYMAERTARELTDL